MATGYEFEIVEEYELLGEKRYRLRIKGTSIYINIAAENVNEALKKAESMVNELQLGKLVEVLSRNSES